MIFGKKFETGEKISSFNRKMVNVIQLDTGLSCSCWIQMYRHKSYNVMSNTAWEVTLTVLSLPPTPLHVVLPIPHVLLRIALSAIICGSFNKRTLVVVHF